MKLQLETAGTERKTKLTVTVICHSLQQWYNPHHVWHLTNVEGIFLSRARPRKITLASVFASEIEFVKKYLDYPAKVRFLIPLGTKMKAHEAFSVSLASIFRRFKACILHLKKL